jgi:hypothetical protein
LKILSNP